MTLIDSSAAESARLNHDWDLAYKLIPQFEKYGGIDELLSEISRQRIPIAIVTSSTKNYCKKVCYHFRLPSSTIIAYHDTQFHKPNPEPIQKALAELHLQDGENVLCLGDTLEDIEAANAAGCISAACLWGRAVVFDSDFYEAQLVFNSTKELLSFLRDHKIEPIKIRELRYMGTYVRKEDRAQASTVDDEHSERTLCLKWRDKNPQINDLVIEEMRSVIWEVIGNAIKETDLYFAAIPSSKPNSTNRGLDRLVSLLLADIGDQYRQTLVRTKEKKQASRGGTRDINTNYETMSVVNHNEIRGKTVVVIDDVYTTGSSIEAAAKLLEEHGAAAVLPFVYSRTQDKWSLRPTVMMRTIQEEDEDPDNQEERETTHINTLNIQKPRKEDGFDRVPSADNDLAENWYYRGLSYYENKDFENACAVYTKALKLGLDNITIYTNRGNAYYMLGDYENAISDYDIALEANPQDSATHYFRGISSYRIEDYYSALADFDTAIETGFIEAYFYRANTNFMLENYKKALVDYDRATLIGEGTPEAHYWLGRTYEMLEDYNNAEANYTAAIKRSLEHNETYYLSRAVTYHILGKIKQALADYTQVISNDPENFTAHFNCGNIYLDLKEYDAALSEYNKAIEINHNEGIVYCNRGFVHFLVKNYDAAVEDSTKAIELDPYISEAYCNRGLANTRKKELDAALKDFTKAIELGLDSVGSAEAYYNRGVVHYILKNYKAALIDYAKVQEFDSDSENNDKVNKYEKAFNYDDAFRHLYIPDHRLLFLDTANERALYISEKTLPTMPYYQAGGDITWNDCTLRKYLSDEYYNIIPKSCWNRIMEVINENPDNPEHGTFGGAPTKDKIFLLSIDEANEYFEDSHDRADGFQYAWWLRSPGHEAHCAAYITPAGNVGDALNVCNNSGVRPVFWLNLKHRKFICPVCGESIIEKQNPCPRCGKPLRWKKDEKGAARVFRPPGSTIY